MINLIYDDAAISDESRAWLINELSQDRPVARWKTLVTNPWESLPEFVSRYYGLSQITTPRSFVLLQRLIADANGGAERNPAGDKLKVPPIPFHRSVAASTSGSMTFQDVNGYVNQITSFASLNSAIAPTAAQNSQPAGTVVAVQLTSPSRFVQKARESNSSKIPPEIRVVGDRDFVALRLLEGGAANCDEHPLNWFSASPFFHIANKRLQFAAADNDARAEILSRAKSSPFVVVDWDSKDARHGHKVMAVVQSILASQNLDFLPITFVQLNARLNNSLADIVDDYKKNFYCPSSCPADQGRIEYAKEWIRDPDKLEKKAKLDPPAPNEVRVNQLVLEAVLWKYFYAPSNGAWVNMSFSTDSGPLNVLEPQFFGTTHSFGVAAASDSHTEEKDQEVPQRAAQSYDTFINVTSGFSTGALLRGYSNTNVPVSAIGPDCGFNFDLKVAVGLEEIRIDSGDKGTSFAAPFVAVWSWIKFLLDQDQVHKLRQEIIMASYPLAIDQPLPIESQGIFDPARLLSLPIGQPFLLTPKGQLTLLSQATISFDYLKGGFTSSITFTPGTDPNISIVFIRRQNSVFARVRRLKNKIPFTLGPPADTAEEYEVVNVRINGKDPDGTAFALSGIDPVLAGMSEIDF